MKRTKTVSEILASPYINRAEMARLFGFSQSDARKVYRMAMDKDAADLGDRVIYTCGEKVRLTSVCWATGVSLNQLLKQKSGLPSKDTA